MTAFVWNEFLGAKPVVHEHQLTRPEAALAENVRIEGRAIEPLRGGTSTKTLQSTDHVAHLYDGQYWVQQSGEAEFVEGLIADDSWKRLYYSYSGGRPRYGDSTSILTGGDPYPNATYWLGIPAPTTTLTATKTGTPDNSEDTAVSRYYVFTFVDYYGQEGPPSDPSNEVEIKPGETVDLTGFPAAPSGSYNMSGGYIRVYRAVTGVNGTQYMLVKDNVAFSDAGENDALADAYVGEVLSTENFYPPDTDTRGFVGHPNGWIAGFYDNTWCASEPGYPYAWKPEYEIPLDDTPVAQAVVGRDIVVATTGYPYIMVGGSPANIDPIKGEFPAPCISKRSMVDMGEYAVYASTNGLVKASANGMELITEGIISKDQWTATYRGAYSAAVYWRGLYWYFYNSGSFIIDPQRPEAGIITCTQGAGYALHTGKNTVDDHGESYYRDTGVLYHIDDGSDLTMKWKSGQFRLPKPGNIALAKVESDAYPITFKLWADGVLKHTETVADANPFWLPSGYMGEMWQWQVEGTERTVRVALAQSVEELAALD